MLQLIILHEIIKFKLYDFHTYFVHYCSLSGWGYVGQSYFSFDNKFYKQDSGLSMGNPVSIFSKIIHEFSRNSFNKSLSLYVQNLAQVCRWHFCNNTQQDALKLLNIQDNSLKFTLETEIDGQLPFLDLKIKKIGRASCRERV